MRLGGSNLNRYTLSNGLRVVVEPIPSFRSVSFGIWVNNGSRHEPLQLNGISHFIEHMLFKGTHTRSAKDIADLFDGIGGNVNAFTAKEYTCYYAKVLDQHLPLAVEALADMFFHSRFDEEDLEKEKNVIFEEIAMYEDTPDDRVHDDAVCTAYQDHPLAYPIIGTESNLTAMTSETLRTFLREHYRVDNTVIAVAGNVDETSLLALLEQHFGHFDTHGANQDNVVPTFNGSYHFQQKQTEQNHICITFPGLPSNDPLIYAMSLLNNAIGGGMSSRLFQEIREKRGLAYSVYSYHSGHEDSGLFTIYTGTAPKQTKEVFDLTIEMMSDLKRNGLTDAELQRGKEQLKGSLILSLESTSSLMTRIGKNELMFRRHLTLDQLIERIDAVTQADIQAVIHHMLSVPFGVAMVGTTDQAITNLRRDCLV